jgi:anti-sigma regulatory factor (Ser/Thr protein kinase)
MDDRREPPDVRYEFENELAAPRGARRALGRLFAAGDPIADDVELAASELVTNVVIHTSGGGVMQAWDPKPDVPLRLEVEDRTRALPAIPSVRPQEGGRGLSIVDAVSDAWGVLPTPRGKVVWAEFSRRAD